MFSRTSSQLNTRIIRKFAREEKLVCCSDIHYLISNMPISTVLSRRRNAGINGAASLTSRTNGLEWTIKSLNVCAEIRTISVQVVRRR